MPQKLNKAGQMQNYIPAGNGDPSGEYGTNNGSGNKNIKLGGGKAEPNVIEDDGKGVVVKDTKKKETKKDETKPNKVEPNVVEDGFRIELDDKGKPKDNDKPKKLKEKIDRVNKSKIPSQAIYDTLGYGEEDMKQMVELVFDSNEFAIYDTGGSAFVDGLGRNCNINERNVSGQESYYSKGGVLYHELGHCIDALYNQETGYTRNWGNIKIYYASGSVVLSNGKTLADILKAEQTYNKKNGILDKIRQDYTERRKELFKEKGIDYDATNNRIKELEKEFEDKRFEYGNDHNYKETWDYYYKIKDENKEYNGLKDKIKNASKDIEKTLCVEYGDISDIRSSVGYAPLNMGHSDSYWKKDVSHKAKEFFAECVSAKGTNPKSWELMKKYYPKSCQAFEELANKIKKEGLKK